MRSGWSIASPFQRFHAEFAIPPKSAQASLSSSCQRRNRLTVARASAAACSSVMADLVAAAEAESCAAVGEMRCKPIFESETIATQINLSSTFKWQAQIWNGLPFARAGTGIAESHRAKSGLRGWPEESPELPQWPKRRATKYKNMAPSALQSFSSIRTQARHGKMRRISVREKTIEDRILVRFSTEDSAACRREATFSRASPSPDAGQRRTTALLRSLDAAAVGTP